MNPTYQHYATHDESEYPHLWRGIVGAWAPCLGPSGTRLHDHSGRANWGTLTNMDAATDWVVDRGQYALDFDGSNDYVLVTKASAFDVLTGNKTLSAWVKTSGAGANFRTIISRDQTFALSLFNNVFVTYDWAVNQTRSTSINIADGRWKHLAITIAAGVTNGSRFWINGLQAGSAFTYSTQNGNVNNDVTIGTAANSSNFIANEHVLGQIDDVAIWSRTFHPNEIRELYQIGRGGMYTPRRRRRAYSFGPSFLAAWARGSNVILQPCGVS